MERYRVQPGSAVELASIDPRDTSAFSGGKEEARTELKRLRKRLTELQHVLWADGRHGVLIVLQAMDCGGKDGTIRRVLRGVNPQGVRVMGFGVPSEEELAHDYLWRVHPHAPKAGEVAVFNRSHYEDVLVVRVMDLAPSDIWARRYDHIVGFEQLLTDEGTTIVKLMLHISREEQAERLRARLEDPQKRWKYNASDLEHRARWDDYMAAYEEALRRTSTADAPWYVVPADRKWYRDLVVARILVAALERLELRYPQPVEALEAVAVL